VSYSLALCSATENETQNIVVPMPITNVNAPISDHGLKVGPWLYGIWLCVFVSAKTENSGSNNHHTGTPADAMC